jgi:hypothetical protein
MKGAGKSKQAVRRDEYTTFVLCRKAKLNDLGMYPCPQVENQDRDAIYRVEQFAERAFSVIGRMNI